MASYLAGRIANAANIELHTDTVVRGLLGEDQLEQIVVEDNRSGATRTLDVRALFVFIGAQANTGWLKEAVALDERGFVLSGRELESSALGNTWQQLARAPYAVEASLPGLFAAGDVRSGSIKRVASAVGEGAMAVKFAHQYLEEAID